VETSSARSLIDVQGKVICAVTDEIGYFPVIVADDIWVDNRQIEPESSERAPSTVAGRRDVVDPRTPRCLNLTAHFAKAQKIYCLHQRTLPFSGSNFKNASEDFEVWCKALVNPADAERSARPNVHCAHQPDGAWSASMK
jgi:hypothetical protein